jgi:hypothetical protein
MRDTSEKCAARRSFICSAISINLSLQDENRETYIGAEINSAVTLGSALAPPFPSSPRITIAVATLLS